MSLNKTLKFPELGKNICRYWNYNVSVSSVFLLIVRMKKCLCANVLVLQVHAALHRLEPVRIQGPALLCSRNVYWGQLSLLLTKTKTQSKPALIQAQKALITHWMSERSCMSWGGGAGRVWGEGWRGFWCQHKDWHGGKETELAVIHRMRWERCSRTSPPTIGVALFCFLFAHTSARLSP